jgi:hypothetical protein
MIKLPRPTLFQGSSADLHELAKLIKDPRIFLAFLLGCIGIAACWHQRFRNARGLAFVAVSLTSATIIQLFAQTFALDWLRYGYNFLTLSLLASFALLLGEEVGQSFLNRSLRGGTRWLSFVLFLLVLAGVAWHSQFARATGGMIATAIAGREWDYNAQAPSHQMAQKAIPVGRRFLAFLPMAHLLDYRRNPVYVIDGMCGISPPPGIPLESGPEDVARYLRALGISWILTTEKGWHQPGKPRALEDFRVASEQSKDPWTSSQLYSYYLVARSMDQLATLYATKHFEDHLIVIDLEQPRLR